MIDQSFDLEIPPQEPTDPWTIFSYEVTMYWGMIKVREQISKAKSWELALGESSKGEKIHKAQKVLVMNAMIESKLLHSRALIDILVGKGKSKDDLNLDHLVRDWSNDRRLTQAIRELSRVYGDSRTEKSPCWIINKMMAHPTDLRANSYNYAGLFEIIDPPLKDCLKRMVEIKSDRYLLDLLEQI